MSASERASFMQSFSNSPSAAVAFGNEVETMQRSAEWKETASPISHLEYRYCEKSTGKCDTPKNQRPAFQDQVCFWKKQLEASQPAQLFCDNARPVLISAESCVEQFALGESLCQDVNELCTKYKVAAFNVLLAAFRATLYRLTGTEDATIGLVVANTVPQQSEYHTNYYESLQCIRTQIQDHSFGQLVKQMQSTVATAQAHQDVSYKQIVSELYPRAEDISHAPLIRIIVVLHSKAESKKLMLDGTKICPKNAIRTSQVDFELHLFKDEHNFGGEVVYASDIFVPATIKALIAVFQELLQEACHEPETEILALPFPCRGLRSCEIEPTDYSRTSSVIDVFREQVAAHPNTMAVKDNSTQLTYSELDHYSDCLSRWLKKQAFDFEPFVGVLANRSCQTITAFLGILKANLAYVPLDTRSPPDRIQKILSSVEGRKLLLLGSNVQIPNILSDDVTIYHIADALGELNSAEGVQCDQTITSVRVAATDVAYIMFTSGSTGQPKGVMIEHRGIVRLVKQSNVISQALESNTVAHVTSISFDVSTLEIYAALLNGGTLICIDYMTLLDPVELSGAFTQQKIRVAMFAPALLKQCLLKAPITISVLDRLYVAGDRLDPQDAFKAANIVRGDVINAYGPTENTVLSTIYSVRRNEKCVNSVPIGQPISNSGAYVMDRRQRLVPIGVIGELVVTGDGLARGYKDPVQNHGRFIQIAIGGNSVRAYRTGDFVRRRPIDGQLEFLGRIDQQVKIRGHRIELGEVEQVLLSHHLVDDAVALVQEDDGLESYIHSFVSLLKDEDTSSSGPTLEELNDREQVEAWTKVFDQGAYFDIGSLSLNKFGRDFAGWNSMYDGTQIDQEEMEEWLNDTINSIANGSSNLGDVLEVGMGTGMILFNLIDRMKRYFGVEPSEMAIRYVTKMAKSTPALANKLQLQAGTATDVRNLDAGIHIDLAVLNSVTQYFPNREYLFRVIKDLLRFQGIKCLYIGDVRSYPLYSEYRVSKALHLAGDKPTKDQIQQKLVEMEKDENELLIDPGFFTQLPSCLPDSVEHVEILPKIMHAVNELSCYRYAAVIHTKCEGEVPKHIHPISDEEWIDFVAHDLSRDSLINLLKASSGRSIVAVSNIPHSKTILERLIIDSLDRRSDSTDEDREWLISAYEKARASQSLSTVDLAEIAQLTNYRVEISWSKQFSQHGGLDAVFHNEKPINQSSRVLFQFPTDHAGRKTSSLTNYPPRKTIYQQIEQQLRHRLQTKLPTYMIPRIISFLDEMPINNNGKVDRQALARRVQSGAASKQSPSPSFPRNGLEAALREEFQKILGREISIHDNFFDCGGDSLLAIRQVSRINERLKLKISIRNFFQYSTVAKLVEYINNTAN